MRLRKRLPSDQAQVLRLLAAANLPPDGLDLTEGWVLEAEGAVVGHVAIEPTPDALVIRSLVVDPAHRGKGLGENLMAEAEAAAAGRALVLKTDTVGPWMERQGYRLATLDQVPSSVRTTTQFSGSLCSGTPVYLKEKVMDNDSELKELRISEIAEIVGITPGAAKIRLHRARQVLRAKMEQQCRIILDEQADLQCDRKIED